MALQSATNTHEEVLRKMLSLCNDLKLTPDADLEWDVNLETMMLQKLREPIDRIQQMTNAPAPPQPMQQGSPFMQGAMQPGGPAGPPVDMAGGGMGMPTVMPSSGGQQMTNPDELRRLLQQ